MKLCLTLAEKSVSDLNQKLGFHDGRVEYIEARLDYLQRLELPHLPATPKSRYIATCRPEREGGEYRGKETERIRFLERAAEHGFHWIDLEHDVTVPASLPTRTRVIRSRHVFGSFPASLPAEFPTLCAGELGKLAVQVHTTRELVQLLEWAEREPPRGPHVLIGMGELGQPSRYLVPLLGSKWTYVCEDAEVPRAPGQFSLREARGLGQASTETPLFGIIGQPVLHSLSPPLHNGLLRHYGLPGSYIRLPLDTLDPWFDYLAKSSLRFQGFSVTLPHKTDVIRFCQDYDSPVRAVNTLVGRARNWVGSNTDFPGFLSPLLSRVELEGTSAVVLGNGGVAHTAVGALLSRGVQVTVAGRNEERLENFARQFGCRWVLMQDYRGRADLLVNTTPVGQHPNVDASPLSETQLNFELVYDLVYSPEQTKLLQQARRRGCKMISGMEMFVEQAARQFLAWTGQDPDRMLIRDLIRKTV